MAKLHWQMRTTVFIKCITTRYSVSRSAKKNKMVAKRINTSYSLHQAWELRDCRKNYRCIHDINTGNTTIVIILCRLQDWRSWLMPYQEMDHICGTLMAKKMKTCLHKVDHRSVWVSAPLEKTLKERVAHHGQGRYNMCMLIIWWHCGRRLDITRIHSRRGGNGDIFCKIRKSTEARKDLPVS